MKKTVLLLSVLSLCACTENLEPTIQEVQEKAMQSQVENTHRVDEAQALEYANLYFSQTQTRSTADLKRDYIVEDIVTRSGQAAKDTLAYVFNRGEEEGFVLVATDNRVYPLLAYSDTGHFEYEKGSTVDFAFVSRLGTYYEENEGEDIQTLTEEEIDACIMHYPEVSTSWGQGTPWDKYVIIEHPGCPVGCVAVATGLIMANCKEELTYKGIKFDFAAINEAIKGESTEVLPQPLHIVSGNDVNIKVKMTKEKAIDYVAQLLYWIGKDLNMNYQPGGSGAVTAFAGPLLKELGYTVITGPYDTMMLDYDIYDVIDYIENGGLVLMRGNTVGASGGHAWVVDGFSKCKLWYEQEYTNVSIHCDWGWDGSCNGYYNGEVFATTLYQFEPASYFAIKNEKYDNLWTN